MKVFFLLASALALIAPKNPIGPLDLNYPIEWVESPVLVSKCNAGEYVDINLVFSCPVKILEGFTVFIEAFGSMYQGNILNKDGVVEVGENGQAEFRNVLMPEQAGAYFLGIFVRTGDYGQILARNYRFTTVGVCETKNEGKDLGIDVGVIEQWGDEFSVGLEFVTYESLEAGYIILVTMNDRISLSDSSAYSIQSNSTVELFKISENYQKFNQLVFKLQNTPQESPIKIQINLSNLQISNYPIISEIAFKIEIIENSKKKILSWFYGSGTLFTQGTISITSWQKANSDSNEVINGLVTFTKLSFSCDHTLLPGSSIHISFTNIALYDYSPKPDTTQALTSIYSPYDSYIYSDLKNLDCHILYSDIAELYCDVLSTINPASKIKIYTLAHFIGDPATIVAIESHDSEYNVIDSSSSFTFAYNSNFITFEEEPECFISGSMYEKNTMAWTGLNNGGLYVNIKLTENIEDSDTITISSLFQYCDSGIIDKICFGSSVDTYYIVSSDKTYDFTTSSAFSNIPSIDQGTLTIYLDMVDNSIDQWINIFIYPSQGIFLPNLASDSKTRHELTIMHKTSASVKIISKPFYIEASGFSSYLFNYMCFNYLVNSKIMNLHVEYNNVIQATEDYEIFFLIWFKGDVNISPDLLTGLSFGDEYPVEGAGNEKFTLIEPTDEYYIAGLKLTQSSGLTTKVLNINFPLAEAYPRYQVKTQICLQDKHGNIFVDSAQVYNNNLDAYVYEPLVTNSIEVNIETQIDEMVFELNSTVTSTDLILIVFPPGFYIGNDVKIVNDSEKEPLNFSVFQGNGKFFQFPTIIVYTDHYFLSYSNLRVYGVTSGQYIGDFYAYVTYGAADNSNWGVDCDSSYAVGVKVNRKDNLWVKDLMPSASPSAGADLQVLIVVLNIGIPNMLNFTSGHLVYIESSDNFGDIISCKIYSSTSNLTSTNSEYYCKGQTTDSLLLKSLTIELSIIPPQQLYETLPLSPLSTLEIQLNNIAILNLNTQQSDFLIEFSPSVQPVPSNTIDLKIFPNFPYEEASDLFIKFIPQYDIPAGSYISVKGKYFDSDSDLNENTWITGGFDSADIVDGELELSTSQLITAGTEFYITKKSAFYITEPGYSEYFLITIENYNIFIIQDTSSNSNLTQKCLFKDSPTMELAAFHIPKLVSNVYEQSLYNVVFKIDTDLTKDFRVYLKFPKAYFQFLGSGSESFESDPGVFYLDRMNDYYECTAAVWIVTCKFFQVQEALNEVEIDLILFNPGTTADYDLSIFISDGSDTIIANYTLVDSIFTETIESSLQDIKITVEDNHEYSSPYNVSIKPGQNITDMYKIILKFPEEYKITAYNPIIFCKLQLITLDSENIEVSCITYSNYIEVKLVNPTSTEENTEILIELNEITKPYSGYTRSSNETNWPDYWTPQISVQIVSNHTYSITHSSPPNFNSAYLGFYGKESSKIKVLCSGQENSVVLKPQTYVKCRFTVDSLRLKAQSIEIIPLSDFLFDQSSYLLTRDFPSVSFKVGAPFYYYQGIYYIDWDIIETPIVTNKNQYLPMHPTQVQIFSESLTTISIIYYNITVNKLTSYPILISMNDFLPFDTLYISISISPKNSFYKLESDLIVFSSSQNFAYTRLIIDESEKAFKINTVNFLNFKLSGKYSEAFEIPAKLGFLNTVLNKTYEVSLKISTEYNETSHSTLVYLDLNDSAIVSWSFGPESAYLNAEYSTYDYIVSQAYPLNGSVSSTQSPFEDTLNIYTQYLNSIQGTDWLDLQLKKKQFISSFIFYKQSFLTPGKHLLFDSFFTIPTLNYSLTLWADNFNNDPKVFEFILDLKEFSEHCSVTIVADKNISDPGSVFALSLNSPLNKISGIELSKNSSGFVYSFTLLSEFLCMFSPWSILNSFSEEEFSLYSNSSISSFSYENISRSSYGIPELNEFSVAEFSDSLTMEVNITIESDIYCIVEYDPFFNRTEELIDILLGKSHLTAQPSYLNESSAFPPNYSLSIPLTNFKTTGSYLLQCVQCNKYPLNPLCTNLNTSIIHYFSLSNKQSIESSPLIPLSLLTLLAF